jgi:hypothetical protein
VRSSLRVGSDLRLPELDAAEPGSSGVQADVRVTLSPEPWRRRPSTHRLGGRRCRFEIPEARSYEVRDGRQILVRPAAGAAAELVRVSVLGFAWGMLVHQRGSFAMRSGVVRAHEGAVAFCGPSSTGKSSTVD